MNRKRKIELMQQDLPYGRRVFADGTKELFNRRYETIARRGQKTTDEIVEQGFYYSDANPPWVSDQTRKKCESILRKWWSQ